MWFDIINKLMHYVLQIQIEPIKQMHNIFPIHHASETNTACPKKSF